MYGRVLKESGVKIRCIHCRELIGVYEPIIILSGADARVTSRAAEPQLSHERSDCYHRHCWEELGDPPD